MRATSVYGFVRATRISSPPFERYGATALCGPAKTPRQSGAATEERITIKRKSEKEGGGEDRNRTYPGSFESTTVLKTARATRHPSLSRKRKLETSNTEHRIRNVECWRASALSAPKDWGHDGACPSRSRYLSFLIAVTTWSKSGQSPESSLEWMRLPLARISKAPPLEGIRVNDLIRSPSSRILVAKLTALGV